jgi:UDPglucose--hexose-1-phosphate uridylyltransferase
VPTADRPHRRYNPLTGEWVLVSPHRTERPWQGAQEAAAPQTRPAYDPACYLCPGNERAGGAKNPAYTDTFVFRNDFAALFPGDGGPSPEPAAEHLLQTESMSGECRVICYSPRHDLTLAEMEPAAIAQVVDVWAEQVSELGTIYPWVQVFENKGAAMGASNPHPHGQVWASSYLPTLPAKETECQATYELTHDRVLLLDVLQRELEQGERIVSANEHWVLLVPFWAVWPFEYLLLPRRHVQRLPDLTPAERKALAEILKDGLRRYDAVFQTTFPYSMGWHGAPTDGMDHPGWQLHAHFFPPLLRSATVRKFMVGFEMLAEAQRDLTPESAAERLRDL